MKVEILSRQLAHLHYLKKTYTKPFALISISEAFGTVDQIIDNEGKDWAIWAKFAELAYSPYCHSMLGLRFEDTVDPEYSRLKAPISETQAKAIASFLKSLQEQNGLALSPTTLVIHCAAGISRSPAIGKVAVELFGQEWPYTDQGNSPYIPNELVYNKIKAYL